MGPAHDAVKPLIPTTYGIDTDLCQYAESVNCMHTLLSRSDSNQLRIRLQ